MKLDPVLLDQVMEPAGFDKPLSNVRLVTKLIKLMKREGGIGLAANQAGISKRVFVMRHQGDVIACWNPEILEFGKVSTDFNEGCLSFPDEICTVTRPEEIDVLYYNCVGKPIQKRLVGIESRCFQHELDHLNGITMWDRHKEQNAKQS
jgi:peptide deformylase